MKVLVIGATGGSGRAVLEALVSKGHAVTAFARRPEALEGAGVAIAQGDATKLEDVERAVKSHDAVVVTLGITENPVAVRLRGSSGTPMDIRSAGTRNVIAAMKKHGTRKLIVQTTYGVGETRAKLPFKWRMIFSLLLKPQIADTEVQEEVVRKSGLDWVLVQPVGLTDGAADATTFASDDGQAHDFSISRRNVAHFIAATVDQGRHVGKSVALSTN